jgi:hypothetical protein
VPPSGFVARRGELAAELKQAGDAAGARTVRGARRPTLAAFAANLLARSKPAETARFLELGRALREAHSTIDPGRLRELSRQQWRVIGALSAEAARLAEESGQRLSDTVRREVESTLRAALADPDAADRWAGGRLETALTPPAGLSALADAAPPAPGPRAATKPDAKKPAARAAAKAAKESEKESAEKDELAERRRIRQERLDRAREKAEAAERTARERREEHTAAEAALAEARERREQARQARDAAERRAAEAREALADADRAHDCAEHREHTAAEALDRADRAAPPRPLRSARPAAAPRSGRTARHEPPRPARPPPLAARRRSAGPPVSR